MKLQSFAIRDALDSDNLGEAIELYLRHFGLPPLVCAPTMVYSRDNPTPFIAGYDYPFFYKWCGDAGFATNYKGPPYYAHPYLIRDRNLQKLSIWTGKKRTPARVDK